MAPLRPPVARPTPAPSRPRKMRLPTDGRYSLSMGFGAPVGFVALCGDDAATNCDSVLFMSTGATGTCPSGPGNGFAPDGEGQFRVFPEEVAMRAPVLSVGAPPCGLPVGVTAAGTVAPVESGEASVGVFPPFTRFSPN